MCDGDTEKASSQLPHTQLFFFHRSAQEILLGVAVHCAAREGRGRKISPNVYGPLRNGNIPFFDFVIFCSRMYGSEFGPYTVVLCGSDVWDS